ncbi:MAG: LPS assembly lipoprotein LptE [Geminicoccaceae bacterium]|nr:LPS assembly lipoprotein LptE [Geminicoccaceae bacterium]MDW8341487.1 LPS assembly lipoprotein LptE [Geminicoccaceae bacterium]
MRRCAARARARRPFSCAIAALLLLASCTLRPLHGGSEGERVNGLLSEIAIEAPRNRLGQLLERALAEEFETLGPPRAPRYRLLLRVEREKTPLAVQLDDVTTRFDLILAARFDLVREADRAVVMRGAARRVASYNVVRAPFATLVAEQDAERRAAKELAREIRTRLAVQLAEGDR